MPQETFTMRFCADPITEKGQHTTVIEGTFMRELYSTSGYSQHLCQTISLVDIPRNSIMMGFKLVILCSLVFKQQSLPWCTDMQA